MALGYLFLPLLGSLKRFVNRKRVEAEVQEAIETLQELAALYGKTHETDNLAKRLARAWRGHFPVFYGSDRRTDVVARRWVTQLNENAKAPSFCRTAPELIHNEVMAWEQSPSRFVYTLLRDRDEHPRIRRGFDLCRHALQERGQKVWEVQGTGEGFLARLLSLSYLGDWSSFYLAVLYGVDPTPVPLIEEIKCKLAGW